MFILRTSLHNPDPAVEPLLAELATLIPDLHAQLADWDAEDRRDHLFEVMAEDAEAVAALQRLHAGDIDDAPDEIVRQLFRELWGEDLIYFEDPRGCTDAVLAFVRKHRLRLFDDLRGRDVVP